MGGLEATQIIRTGEIISTATTPHTKRVLKHPPYIIAVTANAFEEDKRKCIQVGMNEVLTKPINRQQLEASLKKACLYSSSFNSNLKE